MAMSWLIINQHSAARNDAFAIDQTWNDTDLFAIFTSDGDGATDESPGRDFHSNVQGQIEKINNLLADLRSASESNKNSEPFPDQIALKAALGQRLDGLREAFTARRITVNDQIPDSYLIF